MADYSMLNPSGNMEADIKVLVEVLPPLVEKFWVARGRAWHGVETARIDAVTLAQLWVGRVTRIVLAREAGKPVGFLLGSSVPPLLHADRVFQVDAVHGETPEIETGLIDYLVKGFDFMPDRFLSLPDYCPVPAGLAALGDRVLRLYGRS
jgi:hypothetical protein